MDQMIGRVGTVGGSQMTVSLDGDRSRWAGVRVGSLLQVSSGAADVIAGAAEVQLDPADPTKYVLSADLLGEVATANGEPEFNRGVSIHPIPGESVYLASETTLNAAYGEPKRHNFKVGTLYDDPDRPAYVFADQLLNTHFAILGTTGSGKSCALASILWAILARHSSAHVVLLDPHNEYSDAFKGLAEIAHVDNLDLPFWLLSLEEASRVLVRGGTEHEQQAQRLILNDAILWARLNYEKYERPPTWITVDTPVPYRVHDLLRFLNEHMGRVTKADTAIPYLRLRARLESLRNDRRFGFLFSTENDVLADIIGRLLRIPVDGKPLTIVDLSGVPSEIADVIVSTIIRMLFDFAVWCQREHMPPLLLVCEEAQRYVPADERLGFAQTVQIITQIAKEGRKYGVSLALVTQRPSELALSAISQCGTVFALRMGSEADQQFIARTMPNFAREMLSGLPSLPTGEAIVSGEAVRMTMRIRFEELPEYRRPRSGSGISEGWQSDSADRSVIERGIRRWRTQTRS